MGKIPMKDCDKRLHTCIQHAVDITVRMNVFYIFISKWCKIKWMIYMGKENDHWLEARWWGCCNIWFLPCSHPHLAFHLLNSMNKVNLITKFSSIEKLRTKYQKYSCNHYEIDVHYLVTIWTMKMRVCKHQNLGPS